MYLEKNEFLRRQAFALMSEDEQRAVGIAIGYERRELDLDEAAYDLTALEEDAVHGVSDQMIPELYQRYLEVLALEDDLLIEEEL